MANLVFNVAKGRFIELYNRVKSNDPANSAFVLVLFKTIEADLTLQRHDTLADILAAANVEADFTNYVRKFLSDSDLAALPAPDDVNDRRQIDLPDQVIASAGGAVNNNLVKAVVCYDPDTTGGTDANLVPLLAFDHVVTTNGEPLNTRFPNDAGRAA